MTASKAESEVRRLDARPIKARQTFRDVGRRDHAASGPVQGAHAGSRNRPLQSSKK